MSEDEMVEVLAGLVERGLLGRERVPDLTQA
jgi:hypothetical protein